MGVIFVDLKKLMIQLITKSLFISLLIKVFDPPN